MDKPNKIFIKIKITDKLLYYSAISLIPAFTYFERSNIMPVRFKNKGHSLLELLITAAILLFIISISVPYLLKAFRNAKNTINTVYMYYKRIEPEIFSNTYEYEEN